MSGDNSVVECQSSRLEVEGSNPLSPLHFKSSDAMSNDSGVTPNTPPQPIGGAKPKEH